MRFLDIFMQLLLMNMIITRFAYSLVMNNDDDEEEEQGPNKNFGG